VDPLPFLREPPPTSLRAAVIPRAAWVDLGDNAITDNDARDAIEVILVERGATTVRVAVHSPVARFVVWVRRADLLSVLGQEIEVRPTMGASSSNRDIAATLHRGAHVEVLAQKGERSQVRYNGALEVETWVPTKALLLEDEPLENNGAAFRGNPIFNALPGLAIRGEPRWGADLLAVLARGYFLEDLGAVDAAWNEVGYADSAVEVRGFASRQQPPMRLHVTPPPEVASSSLISNETLPAGTCLYATIKGEVVGITEQLAVAAEPADREGWWNVSFETAWGPLRFWANRQGGVWTSCAGTP
jgi:hypothetical protein